jgi:hypothetical protein
MATIATVSGYACEDPARLDTCTAGTAESGLGLGGDFGYENLLLSVSTNAAGGIISVSGIYTQEYCTLGGGPPFNVPCPESWDGGTFTASGFTAETKGNNNIQIDRRNSVPVTITAGPDLDTNCIDQNTLRLGPGLVYTQEVLAPETHLDAGEDPHETNGKTLTAHFRSEEADLSCGVSQVKLRGMCDGVPFTTAVTVNGTGKACN